MQLTCRLTYTPISARTTQENPDNDPVKLFKDH